MNALLTLLIVYYVTETVAQDADRVCFYTRINYSGTQLCGMAGEQIDVYRNYFFLNDRFNSVRVPTGLQVWAFFDDGFHGHNMTFKENTPDLLSFSNRISSFIVQPAETYFSTASQYTTTSPEVYTTRPSVYYITRSSDMYTTRTSGMYSTKSSGISMYSTRSTSVIPSIEVTATPTLSCSCVLQVCVTLMLGILIGVMTSVTCTVVPLCIWR